MIVELDCTLCEGKGSTTDPTGNCRNQSNECCGGCDKEISCDECKGSGTVDVYVNDEYDNELFSITESVSTIYDDLTSRGVSKSEAKKLIRNMVEEIINEC